MEKKNKVWFYLNIIVIIMLVASIYMIYNKYSILENEILSEFNSKDKLYIDGEIYDRDIIIFENDQYYIELDVVSDTIYDKITLSNSGKRIYIEIDKNYIDFEDERLTKYIKDNIVDINVPVMQIADTKYVPLDIISKVLLFDYGEFESDFWILTKSAKISVEKGTKIYINSNINIVKSRVDTEEQICGIDLEGVFFVVTSEGCGYVNAKDITKANEEKVYYSKYYEEKNNLMDEPIYLIWDQINSYSDAYSFNKELLEKDANIISPTFVSLNINGIGINISDLNYIKWAHENNLQVWTLVSNSYNPEWTSEMLNDEILVDRFISQLCLYSIFYDYDGINIDFENIYYNDSEVFDEFIYKLSEITEMMGITLSIDVTIPGGSDQWSKVYNRRVLSNYVDYMMLMVYDEFWASSKTSGPVASIPWAIEGIENTLEEVSNDKLVLGIPGYMRVWKETGGNVVSSTLSIINRDNYLKENGFESVYLQDLKINYTEKNIDGTLYRIWIEDKTSIEQRLEMVDLYNLPGIAVWRRGFMDEEINLIIKENIRQE